MWDIISSDIHSLYGASLSWDHEDHWHSLKQTMGVIVAQCTCPIIMSPIHYLLYANSQAALVS